MGVWYMYIVEDFTVNVRKRTKVQLIFPNLNLELYNTTFKLTCTYNHILIFRGVFLLYLLSTFILPVFSTIWYTNIVYVFSVVYFCHLGWCQLLLLDSQSGLFVVLLMSNHDCFCVCCMAYYAFSSLCLQNCHSGLLTNGDCFGVVLSPFYVNHDYFWVCF